MLGEGVVGKQIKVKKGGMYLCVCVWGMGGGANQSKEGRCGMLKGIKFGKGGGAEFASASK